MEKIMEQKFSDVLEKGEKITKVYRPNKTKFWWATMLLWTFCVWIWSFIILVGSVPEEGKSFNSSLFWLLFGISAGVFVVGMAFTILFAAIYYKNRYYAYTNKRIIIRGGIIGIDYKSLEFKHLTATIVQVTFLDKVLGRNTGNIRFGSPSSPVSSMNSSMNPYAFKHVHKPYDTLREIKEIIDVKDKE